jgi:chromatin remodeling complex protein RSC6
MGKGVKQTTQATQVVESVPKTPRKKVTPVPPLVEPEKVTEPTNEVVVEEEDATFADVIAKHMQKLQELTSALSSVKSDFKNIEKRWSRELKTAQKGMKKKKNANRQPSGFVKPTRITDELADFLEKPHGVEMARTQVTREINTYIRAHSLATGRNINPDDKLMALLKIPDGEILTYFNLQKYMSPHFHKNVKVEAVV